KSDAYQGLNLTRATLDALLKYKRSHSEALAGGEGKFFYDADLPLVEWVCQGQRDERTSFECQIMDWADGVAYSVHDVEDGMWARLITRDSLRSRRLPKAMAEAVPETSPAAVQGVIDELLRALAPDDERARRAAVKTWSSYAIFEMVRAAVAEPADDGGLGPRYARRLCVEPEIAIKSRLLKALAQAILFRHRSVSSVRTRAERIVGGLFRALADSPELIPEDWRTADPRRSACDYISGMTEDEAARTYRKLSRFGPSASTGANRAPG